MGVCELRIKYCGPLMPCLLGSSLTNRLRFLHLAGINERSICLVIYARRTTRLCVCVCACLHNRKCVFLCIHCDVRYALDGEVDTKKRIWENEKTGRLTLKKGFGKMKRMVGNSGNQ
jgi:hypothetical protein